MITTMELFFGVDKNVAFPYALVMHVLLFLPPMLFAGILLPREGITLFGILRTHHLKGTSKHREAAPDAWRRSDARFPELFQMARRRPEQPRNRLEDTLRPVQHLHIHLFTRLHAGHVLRADGQPVGKGH